MGKGKRTKRGSGTRRAENNHHERELKEDYDYINEIDKSREPLRDWGRGREKKQG